MKEFLQFVVGQLVDRPEELVIHEEVRGDTLHFVLELPRAEVGKVIGKQGHTIQAIRNVLACNVLHHGERVSVEIHENSA